MTPFPPFHPRQHRHHITTASTTIIQSLIPFSITATVLHSVIPGALLLSVDPPPHPSTSPLSQPPRTMGVFYEQIPDSLIPWILSQHLFYVATAPLSPNGHINVSPKGNEKYFGIDSPTQFWYQELSGSGNETMSHLYEPNNARICIMFNAFVGPPKIVRLWGRGRVLENGNAEFEEFVKQHDQIEVIPGTRSIVIVDVEQVGSSCGFSVPFFDFVGHRDVLNDLWRKRDEKHKKTGTEKVEMDKYWAYKNAWSVDGLPGMKRGVEAAGTYGVEPIKKMVGPVGERLAYARKGTGGRRDFTLEQLVLAVLAALVVGAMAAVHGPGLVEGLHGVSVGGRPRESLMAWSRREI